MYATVAKWTSGSKQSSDFNAGGLAAINKTGITQLKVRFAQTQTSNYYIFLTKTATLHVEW